MKINEVPCRVCGADAGQPCTRQGSRVAIHGWHGGRVDDAARAEGLVGAGRPEDLTEEERFDRGIR